MLDPDRDTDEFDALLKEYEPKLIIFFGSAFSILLGCVLGWFFFSLPAFGAVFGYCSFIFVGAVWYGIHVSKKDFSNK